MIEKHQANESFAELNQRWLQKEGQSVAIDGWAGAETEAAWRAQTGFSGAAELSPWPAPDERSLQAFYGEPGEHNLVMINLPYPMLLAWDHGTTVTRTRCHRRVADSLTGALEAIRDHYGDRASLEAARMHLYGGVYAFRKQRGSDSAWSTHAWGMAIDLDPKKNGFRVPWPAPATMPIEVIDIFQSAGWKSGALAWGRDAMHFQATR